MCRSYIFINTQKQEVLKKIPFGYVVTLRVDWEEIEMSITIFLIV